MSLDVFQYWNTLFLRDINFKVIVGILFRICICYKCVISLTLVDQRRYMWQSDLGFEWMDLSTDGSLTACWGQF
jgi:hypothetical protein